MRASPVAVGHDGAVRLAAGLLALPAPQPLLTRPAPPLPGGLLLVVIVPEHAEGSEKKKSQMRGRKDIFFSFLFPPSLKPTFNPSSSPQLNLQVRNFKVNDSLNWTVITTVTRADGFASGFFFSPHTPAPLLFSYHADLSAVRHLILLIEAAVFTS